MYISGLSFEIASPYNASIHAHQSLAPELRHGCCGYKGRILKWSTGLGIQTVLMLPQLNSVEQVDHGDEYDFVSTTVESWMLVALPPKEIKEATVTRDCP